MKNTTRDRAIISGLKGACHLFNIMYLIILVMLTCFQIVLYFDEPIGQESQNVNNE